MNSCASTAASGSVLGVASMLPEAMRNAVAGVKLLGPMKVEWDQSDIAGAMLSFEFGMERAGVPLPRGTNAEVYAEPDSASALGVGHDPEYGKHLDIAKLLFWLQRTAQLDNVVFPHPRQALADYLARKVNAVWAHSPELVGPRAHWDVPVAGIVRAVPAPHLNVAAVLAVRGILLDPAVLEPDLKEALDHELTQPHCLALALKHRRYGVLDYAASLNEQAAERVCALLSETQVFLGLACAATDPATPAKQVESVLEEDPGSMELAGGHGANVRTAAAARRLLERMANRGFKTTPPQPRWASGTEDPALGADGEPLRSALTGCVLRLLVLAGEGADTSGFEPVIRDTGTVVGYATDEAGDRALAAEFGGAIARELVQLSVIRWPQANGAAVLDPSANKFLGAMMDRRGGDGSFIDNLVDLMVRAGLGPQDVVCTETDPSAHRLPGAAKEESFTLGDAMRASMPPGTVELYEAKMRAARMTQVIEQATAEAGVAAVQVPGMAAQEEPAPHLDAPANPEPRRRRLRL